MSFFPESHRTPYRDIFWVPPASFVRITPDNVTVHKYWNLESAKPVRYRTDRQYEEHFVSVFREAVRRRIAHPGPILAELSGGMDSTSIVCMADSVVQTNAGFPRIDTVTYFDPEESNWDELPFAQRVEEKRGRAGHHIEIGPAQGVTTDRLSPIFAPCRSRLTIEVLPPMHSTASCRKGTTVSCYRGSVATKYWVACRHPFPNWRTCLLASEEADSSGNRFAGHSRKRNLSSICGATASCRLRPISCGIVGHETRLDLAAIRVFANGTSRILGFSRLRFAFLDRCPACKRMPSRSRFSGRQMSCAIASTPRSHEWRYPFLDRDLVTFCSSIPREQMVRPHQRRSLMRRALAGLVPREILDRKRKAYVSRGVVKIVAAEWSRLNERGPWRTEENGLVIPSSLAAAVEQAVQGEDTIHAPSASNHGARTMVTGSQGVVRTNQFGDSTSTRPRTHFRRNGAASRLRKVTTKRG